MPETEARIPVLDRGFLYADGLFETLRAYRGRPFRLEAHWERLRSSASFLGISVPRADPSVLVAHVLSENGFADARIRITLTRGPEPVGPRPGPGTRATLVTQAAPLRPGLETLAAHGAAAGRLPWPLRARGLALQAHKTLAYLPSVLALGSTEPGVEPILENTDGHVAEGATSNVFWVRDRRLLTPHPEAGCLPGITRRTVMELAPSVGLEVEEGFFPWPDLAGAEEAFLTNSVTEVVPLIRVDAERIGTGAPGPWTRRLQAAYRERVEQEVSSL